MVERIEWKGETLALILRNNYEPEGVSFVTPEDNPIQLGVLKHQKGTKIAPHIHKKSSRTISDVQEVLHIQYGKIEVEFYDNSNERAGRAILTSGDTILLISGGHGFNVLEDSKLIEVKQGPYRGVEEDKIRI